MTTNTYLQELSAVGQAFDAAWKEGSPAVYITPIAWPGLSFTQPTDASGNVTAFVVFNITPGQSQQISIGNPGSNIFRHPELLTLKIYTPGGRGEQEALTLADKFCTIFRNLVLDGILFKAPYIQKAGNTDDGMYQVNCFCPFDRDSFL